MANHHTSTLHRIARFAVPALLLVAPLIPLLLPLAVSADSPTPYIQNPISCNDALCLFKQFIRFFLGGVAVISTAMFVWGGYLFLTSAGNAEQVKKGKDTLLWSGLGIAAILASWAILQYFIKGIVGTTSSG